MSTSRRRHAFWSGLNLRNPELKLVFMSDDNLYEKYRKFFDIFTFSSYFFRPKKAIVDQYC